ncbi:MAG: shikimate kinase [Clostridiaceae bacterium]
MSKNLVLIGMPGSGKSTIGKLLSERLSYKFIDSDLWIEEKLGETINDMFLKGEDYFRKEESKAYEEIAKLDSVIISTGGGVVKNPKNMEVLGVTGTIVFIDRTVEDILSDIEVSARPLLKEGKEKLYKLYEERYDLYKKYAHIIVKNDKSLDEVLNDIIDKAVEKK